jgi:hypothetical protein
MTYVCQVTGKRCGVVYYIRRLGKWACWEVYRKES